MAVLVVLVALGGEVGGAIAIVVGLALAGAAIWWGTRTGRTDAHAIRAYEEDGAPLPRRITRKMDRWRRRHPGEHQPWERPS